MSLTLSSHAAKPLAAAALAVAGAVALTACGGSGGGGGDKISDAPTTSATSAPATTASAAPTPSGAPAINLPADVKVEITDPGPGKDAATTKAIADLEYAIKALLDGTAQGDGSAASMRYAYTGQAGAYWAQRIAAVKQSGQTITGTYRYYRIDAQASGQGIQAHYCEDQSKAFGKDVKTGKVNRNAPSVKSYLYYTVGMFKDTAGTWQVSQVNWTKGAHQCLNG